MIVVIIVAEIISKRRYSEYDEDLDNKDVVNNKSYDEYSDNEEFDDNRDIPLCSMDTDDEK